MFIVVAPEKIAELNVKRLSMLHTRKYKIRTVLNVSRPPLHDVITFLLNHVTMRAATTTFSSL